MTPFTDTTVLVTGGGSGIGRATAVAFAREGARVVVAGRRPHALAETVGMIEAEGGTATDVPADLTRADDVERLIATVADRHGRLDVAANAAGIRINSVSPGPTDTQMSLRPGETEADRAQRLRTALPIGRVGATEEIAAAVLWLASPAASFAVGHDLVVDGGASA